MLGKPFMRKRAGSEPSVSCSAQSWGTFGFHCIFLLLISFRSASILLLFLRLLTIGVGWYCFGKLQVALKII